MLREGGHPFCPSPPHSQCKSLTSWELKLTSVGRGSYASLEHSLIKVVIIGVRAVANTRQLRRGMHERGAL